MKHLRLVSDNYGRDIHGRKTNVRTSRVVINDGGRAAAGFKGKNVGDCVARAVSIASGRPYEEVYAFLAEGNRTQRHSKRERQSQARTGRKTAQHGIFTRRQWFKDYLVSLGFVWVPTMFIGSGCQVHLCSEELPKGNLIAMLTRHAVAVIDGVVHDTYDSTRGGKRCVYGYWKLDKKKTNASAGL